MRIDSADLRKLTPTAKSAILSGIVSHQHLIFDAGINSPLRLCHFLAQLAHESAHFTTTREFASGAAYEGRKNLGNTQKGDGKRYRGRGLIQITGRSNSRDAGKALGYDYEANPTLMETFPHALLVSIWFWNSRKLSALADKDDLRAITKKINGGYNGLKDRQSYLAKAKAIWGTSKARSEPAAPAEPRAPTPRPAYPTDDPRLAMRRKEIIEQLQQDMRDFGFPEVGLVDGRWGGRTADTILAYRRERALPLIAEIDRELLDDIKQAKAEGWTRPVSRERATLTMEDIEGSAVIERSEEAKVNTERAGRHIGVVKQIMVWLGLGSIGGGVAEDQLNPDQVTERMGFLQRAGAFALDNWWIVILVAGIGAVFFYLRWTEKRLARAHNRIEATQRARLISAREGRHV